MGSSQLFQILQGVGNAIADHFGPSCEVLLHNCANPDKSIIWYQGNVVIGELDGPIAKIALEALNRHPAPQDFVNHALQSVEGHPLKSSIIFLRDENSKILGFFCFSVDLSYYAKLKRLLDSLLTSTHEFEIEKSFCLDVHDPLSAMILEGLQKLQLTTAVLNRDDRIRLVGYLDTGGFFEMRKSIPTLARHLRVSRFTLYNDLKHARQVTSLSSQKPQVRLSDQ